VQKQHHSSLPPHNPHTRTPIYTLTYGYSSTTGLSWLERCTGIAGLIPTRGPTIFAKNYGTGAVIDNLKEITPPHSPSSMLGREKCDVWLQPGPHPFINANIDKRVGEGG
jgi:hypothetical protein